MSGWGKIKIKDHLSPAEAETWTELGKNKLDVRAEYSLRQIRYSEKKAKVRNRMFMPD